MNVYDKYFNFDNSTITSTGTTIPINGIVSLVLSTKDVIGASIHIESLCINENESSYDHLLAPARKYKQKINIKFIIKEINNDISCVDIADNRIIDTGNTEYRHCDAYDNLINLIRNAISKIIHTLYTYNNSNSKIQCGIENSSMLELFSTIQKNEYNIYPLYVDNYNNTSIKDNNNLASSMPELLDYNLVKYNFSDILYNDIYSTINRQMSKKSNIIIYDEEKLKYVLLKNKNILSHRWNNSGHNIYDLIVAYKLRIEYNIDNANDIDMLLYEKILEYINK